MPQQPSQAQAFGRGAPSPELSPWRPVSYKSKRTHTPPSYPNASCSSKVKKKCLQKTCKEQLKSKARKSLGVHHGAGLPNGGVSLVEYYSAGKTSELLKQYRGWGQEAPAECRCLTQHGSRHLRPQDQQDSAETMLKAEHCFRRGWGGL